MGTGGHEELHNADVVSSYFDGDRAEQPERGRDDLQSPVRERPGRAVQGLHSVTVTEDKDTVLSVTVDGEDEGTSVVEFGVVIGDGEVELPVLGKVRLFAGGLPLSLNRPLEAGVLGEMSFLLWHQLACGSGLGGCGCRRRRIVVQDLLGWQRGSSSCFAEIGLNSQCSRHGRRGWMGVDAADDGTDDFVQDSQSGSTPLAAAPAED